ncbi:DUF58 domain-containing protein [Natronincola ferrireducens]|uniref:Uncharacterized conserved protein, DUF58 family, contains vWF domain n=1 Tax=Natronincola ferrireducens TaxID=393762 RepID=A0A1G9E817_9FIRM|nr:DUF58 domain-containing protein [Natronincola ferrireducens]SDK72227.1 Uncharacterized conserved protein, DUF58 family, contains vWF domain [Natronincola ferrireducens]
MSKEELSLKNNYEDDEEKPQSLETSILFERHGIWVLVGFLLIAIWYRFLPLAVVSIFLGLLFIIITAWKNRSLMGMKPTLQLSKSRVFTDEEFVIDGSLYNDKWLPLIWIEWSFLKNEGICLGHDDEESYTIRFLWLLWFQKVKWTLKGKALRRGVYDIGQVILRSGDGFRFGEIEELHNLDKKLYVYPKLLSVWVPSYRSSMQWGVKGKQGGFIEDPLLVNGIREYQAGDELRRFNWRATSRTGKLQVNIYQPIVIEQLIIYIDVEGFGIDEKAYEDPIEQRAYVSKKREAFERFLSIIASVAVKYKEQGISIGFTSNGLNYRGEKMSSIPPSIDLALFLDQLAQITQRVGVKKMKPLDELLHKGRMCIPLYIFCHHVTEDHYSRYQQHKHKLSEVRFYYNHETEYTKKLAPIVKPIDTFLSSLDSSGKESNYA